MPAKRLTADCIWNSFLNSNKRHIIITGDRSRGKTTLLSELFTEKLPGITTRAEPEKEVVLTDNLSGQTAKIGKFDPKADGKENRMLPLKEGFLSLGISAIERAVESDSDWVTVDEIGYLESQCEEYLKALRDLFSKKCVAAVVRKQNLPFLCELCSRDDAFVVDLDDPFGDIGCVIMASGLGKRFGGNKLMADFHGEPMICRVIEATEDIFAKRVVVTRHKDVAELCKSYGVEAVLHDLPYRNDTIRLGLEALGDVQRCMFATSDQPLLKWQTVASLALVSKNDTELIWRTAYEYVQGSPVVFPEWTFDVLLNLEEGKGGGEIIKKYPEHLRTVKVRDENELKDIDTPEELRELLLY